MIIIFDHHQNYPQNNFWQHSNNSQITSPTISSLILFINCGSMPSSNKMKEEKSHKSQLLYKTICGQRNEKRGEFKKQCVIK